MAVDQEVVLGQEVKDRVTGYRGIVVSRTKYLQGCDRLCVQPKWKKGEEMPKPQDFDELDLIIVGHGILPKPEPEPAKSTTGGPRPVVTPR